MTDSPVTITPDSETPISKEEFAALMKRAGLSLPDDQTERLRDAYKYVAEMAQRVRTPRGREAEPAHIFVAPKPADP